ncbi:MAG: type III-B CRISPR-associated protein Cas10/Cmr2 [Archaeoglobales archaeon]|nr:type III-B CRISPR-associated protein Cas10/Cmr2 [Archaeoglobales archaeon]
MAYWQRKIVALLHDPPDKALQISRHEDRASVLMQLALKDLPVPSTEIPDASWVRAAKNADKIASAADRPNFPGNVEVLDWTHPINSLIIHPLSGQRLPLNITSPKQSHNAQEEAVRSLSQKSNDPQKRFLLFWRCFEEELHRHEPNLPWELLPADTRVPNHSLLHHNRVASAFAAIAKPATLVFSIGPVQSFIATARKTRDLWMGSYLLSYLIWHAIKVIAEKLGPDHVIYPSLLEQPLVDFWLSEKDLQIADPDDSRLRLATFPNKFNAIVPAEEAENLAKECEKAVCNEWKRLADEVWKQLTQEAPEFNNVVSKIWQRQVEQFSEIYWAIYEWNNTPEEIAGLYKELTGDERFEELLELKGAYPSNQGTVYAACHDLSERALAARKSTRNFEQIFEPAGKCTICGEREVLHDQRDWQGRKFWQEVAKKLSGHVKQDGSERLCAICAIKRFVLPFVLKDKLGLKGDFPSTDSVAAATFVKTVLEKWEQTKSEMRDLIATIERTALKRVAFTEMDIPKLIEMAEKIGDDAKKFVSLDGEWFFLESYDRERLERTHGVKLNEDDLQELRKALSDLCKVADAHPTDYYAILIMDGDGMGKWLSGTHEGLANFEAMLHPKALEQLKDDQQWQKVLSQKRLISPSLHAAISQALTNFALHCVPYVVEELHYGRLVYAGGDDVLAFLPLAEALSAAYKLRALFSGEAERKFNGDIEVEFDSGRWTGWIDWDGKKLLTMGNKATASVGIVIAHRLHPLRDALQQAREAEEDAKERYGRNAICVRWLKRSGERVQMGAKFFYPKHCVKDTLELLLKVKAMMEGKGEVKLSSRFANALMEEAFALVHLPVEAQEAELLRLLRRHSEGEKEAKERVLPELAHQLAQLADALNCHAKRDADPYDLTKPQYGLLELAKWITLMRFLAGGE